MIALFLNMGSLQQVTKRPRPYLETVQSFWNVEFTPLRVSVDLTQWSVFRMLHEFAPGTFGLQLWIPPES